MNQDDIVYAFMMGGMFGFLVGWLANGNKIWREIARAKTYDPINDRMADQ